MSNMLTRTIFAVLAAVAIAGCGGVGGLGAGTLNNNTQAPKQEIVQAGTETASTFVAAPDGSCINCIENATQVVSSS